MLTLKHPSRLVIRACLVGTAVLACSAPRPSMAQTKPVFVLRHNGIEATMPDPNDDGLRRALMMLTERLPEIPGELARFVDDRQARELMKVLDRVMPLLAQYMVYPTELAMLDNGENELGIHDIDLRIIVDTGNDEVARQLTEAITALFQMASPRFEAAPSRAQPHMREFPTLLGTLIYGPANDSGRFAIGMDFGGDGIETDRCALPAPPDLDGLDPVCRGYVDVRALLDVVGEGVKLTGSAQWLEQYDEFVARLPEGFVGIDSATAYMDDRRISVSRISGLAALAPGFDMSALEPVSRGDLRLIPRDARMFNVAREDLGAIIEHALAEAGAENTEIDIDAQLDQVAEMLGFHPIDDLVAALGKTWVFYTADGTGGGGLMSLVILNGGVDGDRLSRTMDLVIEKLNELAAPLGYVRIQDWSGDNLEEGTITSLAFPGLPIPLELCWAVEDDVLVAGLTPQAVQAALEQAQGGRDSILDNRRFRRAVAGLGDDFDDAVQIKFVDMARTVGRGYPIAQLIGSSLANFVRSPGNAQRDPGQVTPSYRQLTEQVRPLISITRMDGDDFVIITVSDASWLVNIAGILGALSL